MTFQGGLALGSILWGFIAEHSSTPRALVSAACGLALSLPVALRFHILRGAMPDLTPYQWKNPPPQLAHFDGLPDEDPTAGPVRISIEYTIPIPRYAEFTRAIHRLRDVRLRDGAIRWGIFRDAQNPELLNETFVMESWLDYLRSRERITAADVALRDRVRALHSLPTPPHVSHQLYAREVPQESPLQPTS